jgi:hypothetical protein
LTDGLNGLHNHDAGILLVENLAQTGHDCHKGLPCSGPTFTNDQVDVWGEHGVEQEPLTGVSATNVEDGFSRLLVERDYLFTLQPPQSTPLPFTGFHYDIPVVVQAHPMSQDGLDRKLFAGVEFVDCSTGNFCCNFYSRAFSSTRLFLYSSTPMSVLLLQTGI